MKVYIKLRFDDTDEVFGVSIELRPEMKETNAFLIEGFVRDVQVKTLEHARNSGLV